MIFRHFRRGANRPATAPAANDPVPRKVKPLVSVVIPHLNEPIALRDCLYALERQQTPDLPFEVIVVDNGSRQAPAEICAQYVETRLERELVPGPGAARNRGAAVARADILAFIDADCVADAGWVRGIRDFLAANADVDVVGGDIRVMRTGSKETGILEAYEDLYSYRAKLFVERDGYAATGNMAVRADVFRAVGGFDGIGTYEDMMWGRRAGALGYRVAYLPSVRVFTPACRSFEDLKHRLNRLVAHGYRDFRDRPHGKLRWIARSAAMALSPLAEIGRLLASDRLVGPEERLRTFAFLARVRLYRARKMLLLALGGDAYGMVARWNRS